jgi:hypothetical protein
LRRSIPINTGGIFGIFCAVFNGGTLEIFIKNIFISDKKKFSPMEQSGIDGFYRLGI